MVKFSAVLAALLMSVTTSGASVIVQLPLDSNVTIEGPFPPEPVGNSGPSNYVPVQLALNYGPLQLPPVPPYQSNSIPVSYGIVITAQGGEGPAVFFEDAETNVGGGCDMYCANPNHTLLLTANQHQIFAGAYFIYNLNYPIIYPLTDYFSLTATLPDGYYVDGVPEPSTWAMLLSGFVVLGWFAYSRKRSPERSERNARSLSGSTSGPIPSYVA